MRNFIGWGGWPRWPWAGPGLASSWPHQGPRSDGEERPRNFEVPPNHGCLEPGRVRLAAVQTWSGSVWANNGAKRSLAVSGGCIMHNEPILAYMGTSGMAVWSQFWPKPRLTTCVGDQGGHVRLQFTRDWAEFEPRKDANGPHRTDLCSLHILTANGGCTCCRGASTGNDGAVGPQRVFQGPPTLPEASPRVSGPAPWGCRAAPGRPHGPDMDGPRKTLRINPFFMVLYLRVYYYNIKNTVPHGAGRLRHRSDRALS